MFLSGGVDTMLVYSYLVAAGAEFELIDYDLGGKEEMPTKLVKVFQEALKKKGRNVNPPNVSDGAMM